MSVSVVERPIPSRIVWAACWVLSPSAVTTGDHAMLPVWQAAAAENATPGARAIICSAVTSGMVRLSVGRSGGRCAVTGLVRRRWRVVTNPRLRQACRTIPSRTSKVWTVDFQFDATTDGRPIKIASIVDES
jgi:hypothetical protein